MLLEREKQVMEVEEWELEGQNTHYNFFKALVNGLVRCEESDSQMEEIFICTSYMTVLVTSFIITYHF